MKVLIIGAGALGIAVGASLKDGGADVDFLVRGETKTAIEKNGISRTGFFKDIKIETGQVGTYESYEKLPKLNYDYVVISTKTLSNGEISSSLYDNSSCMKPDCKIIFMQNGMGYEEDFLNRFDRKDIFHSRVISGFKKNAKNESEITVHQAPILIGTVYGGDNESVEPFVEAMNKSGFPIEVSDEIRKAIWAKFIYNTTLNPLGAILGLTYGELAASEYAHSIMDILIEETFAIMKASGSETFWDDPNEYREVFFNELVPSTANHRSSTLQDMEKGHKTEIDTMSGTLLNLASNCDVSAPMHSMVYWLVKALEEKYKAE